MQSLDRHDEIEGRGVPVGSGLQRQDQAGVEDGVGLIGSLIGEEKLRGEQRAAGGLHFEVDVLGAAGVEPGDDGLELVAAGCFRLRWSVSQRWCTRLPGWR